MQQLAVAHPVVQRETGTVMIVGVLGTVTYLAVNGLGELFEAAGTDDEADLAGIHGDGTAVEKSPGGPAPPLVGLTLPPLE